MNYSGQCLNEFRGHSGDVVSVCSSVSDDSSKIVSSDGPHGNIKIWDATKTTVLSRQRFVDNSIEIMHVDRVKAVCFTPYGLKIVSGAWDHTIKVWDVESSLVELSFEAGGHIESLCVTSDGSKIIALMKSLNNSVTCWDLKSGKFLYALEGPDEGRLRGLSFDGDNTGVRIYTSVKFTSVCVSGNGLRVAAGWNLDMDTITMSNDRDSKATNENQNLVLVWDMSTTLCVMKLAGHSDEVSCVCANEDGSTIVSGSRDRTIRIWDAMTLVCVQTLECDSFINSVCIWLSPDGDGCKIVSGSDDRTMRIWDVATGVCIRILNGHNHSINSVCVSPNGSTIVSGSRDQTVRIWDVVPGVCVRTLEGHSADVTSVCISPDGYKIVSGSDDRTVRIWDAVQPK